MSNVRRVRSKRSEIELDALAATVVAWRAAARDALLPSQRRALGDTFEEAARSLKKQLAALDGVHDDADFFEACTRTDAAAGWLRRLFDYYRVRVEQRMDCSLGPVLHAADEVLWSCYCAAFPDHKPARPMPLTFFEPSSTPWALESSRQFLDSLAPSGAAAQLVARMPVPLVAVPFWVAHSPWWLVHLAHEAGHHVWADSDAPRDVATVILDAVRGTAPEREAAWRGWIPEVFADLWATAAMGRWAVSALADTLQLTPARLVRSDYRYPSPLARLRLCEQFVAGLHSALAPASVWWALPAAAPAELASDWAIAEQVAIAAAREPLRSLWARVATADLEATIANYATELAAGRTAWGRAVETARLVTCAAFQAWTELSVTTSDPAASDARTLAAFFTKTARDNAPLGERSASDGLPANADLLLEALMTVATQEVA